MKKLRLIVEDNEERKLNRAETFNALSSIHPDVWAQYRKARHPDKGGEARQALGYDENKIPTLKDLHQHFLGTHKIPIAKETFNRWVYNPKSGTRYNKWLQPNSDKLDRAARLVTKHDFSISGAAQVTGIGPATLKRHKSEVKDFVRTKVSRPPEEIADIVDRRRQGHTTTQIRNHYKSIGKSLNRNQLAGILNRHFKDRPPPDTSKKNYWASPEGREHKKRIAETGRSNTGKTFTRRRKVKPT